MTIIIVYIMLAVMRENCSVKVSHYANWNLLHIYQTQLETIPLSQFSLLFETFSGI